MSEGSPCLFSCNDDGTWRRWDDEEESFLPFTPHHQDIFLRFSVMASHDPDRVVDLTIPVPVLMVTGRDDVEIANFIRATILSTLQVLRKSTPST